ncbi:MAG: DUF4230 domain-containing protein [Spirochaetales bacterium]
MQDEQTIELEEQVRSLLQLATYEFVYRDLVYFGEERSFLFLKTVDKAVLFSIDITVRAGVDLSSEFRILRDRWAPDRLYVQMPAAEVLSVDADETSIDEYFIRERGGRIELADLNQQLDQAKELVSEDAIERDILGKAQENAQAAIEQFLRLAGFAQIEFAVPDEAEVEEGELRG